MIKPYAVIDADTIKYRAAKVGDRESILVTHKTSGRTKEFKTITEFRGRKNAKEVGGWLGDINSKRTSPFLLDEFEIEKVVTHDKIENVLHTAKMMFQGYLATAGTDDYIGFIGKGDSWRVERSTVMKYKGNRDPNDRPLYLDDVGDYMMRKFNIRQVRDVEADDQVVIEAYRDPKAIVLSIDKDSVGQPCKTLNPDDPDSGIIDGDQFGEIWWVDSMKKCKGYGRKFLYYQILYGDNIDNYRAGFASKLRWGEKTAYESLAPASNDEEAFKVLEASFKKLYPEPTSFEGWRGDKIAISGKYMLQEMLDMARMLRWKDDHLSYDEFKETVLKGEY